RQMGRRDSRSINGCVARASQCNSHVNVRVRTTTGANVVQTLHVLRVSKRRATRIGAVNRAVRRRRERAVIGRVRFC
ncbi:hypothetical protein, partial [Streptococcus pneumoniae]|uniref:hypothetical protein n=1 Tax=Streptococcus pneumoniae TaxID=1313 RepID=UPI001652CCC6